MSTRGHTVRNALAVAVTVGLVAMMVGGGAVSAASAQGPVRTTHPVTVVTTKMPGQVPDTSAAQIAARINGAVNDWTRPATDGFIDYSVVRTADLPTATEVPCVGGQVDYDQMVRFAESVAAQANWQPSSAEERLVIYYPKYSPCSNMAGRAFQIDGKPVLTLNGNYTAPNLTHELTHHLGLGHSNTYLCGTNIHPVTDTRQYCENREYGNRDDLMGSGGTGYLNAVQLGRLGLMPSSDVIKLPTTATASIAPIATGRGNKRVIQVQGYSGTYMIEYRAAVGLDSHISPTSMYHKPGIRIHKVIPDIGTVASLQLDAHPATNPFDDNIIDQVSPAVGVPVDLDDGTITVTVRSQNGASAVVDVSVNEQLPLGPDEVRAVATPGNIAISWDPSAADRAANITGYSVGLDFIYDPDNRTGAAGIGDYGTTTTHVSSYQNPGIKARYWVISQNASGYSPKVYSDPVTIPVGQQQPLPPLPNPTYPGGTSGNSGVHAVRTCHVFYPKVRYKGKKQPVRVKKCVGGTDWNKDIKKALKKKAKKKAKRKARKLYARGQW